MIRTFLASLLPIVMLIPGSTANAQKAGRVDRIGYLASTRSAFTSAAEDALRRDLRALGYIEGQNIVIESRSAEGFVINLKTAKKIGLTIPPNVLARADRIIR